MRTLYHLWLSAHARKVRIVLSEKKLAFNLEIERVWERRPEFLALNPAGEVPVLEDVDGSILSDSSAICEYLEEVYPEIGLLGTGGHARAEVRRLIAWFDYKFDREVTQNLVGEKINKRLTGIGEPDSRAIRAGRTNIHIHMNYVEWLVDRRRWLAGEFFSLADIAAAAHLSTLDYIGDVPWEDHPGAKDWYARLKSRPSFRAILKDIVPGMPPSKHYENLDF
ncbi:MAG: glutathione S-transferase family protein [Alphaproteobacteria bacterium]|nr:glutathione S-transferase family protein [Alphaproteobacteria bacterium]